jgi:hypothetical protein
MYHDISVTVKRIKKAGCIDVRNEKGVSFATLCMAFVSLSTTISGLASHLFC